MARRRPSSAASSVVTPAANDSGRVERGRPGRPDDLRQRRRRGDHHRGAAGQRLQGRQPERLVRTGGERRRRPRPAAAARRGRSGTKPRNVTGRPAARRSRAARRGPSPGDDEPHPVPGCAQGGHGVDAALWVLLRRESSTVDEQGVGTGGERAAQRGVVVARGERGQVDPERDLHARCAAPIRSNSARANAVRAHDGVVGCRPSGRWPRRPPGGPVGSGSRNWVSSRSSRSCEMTTLGTPRRAAHAPESAQGQPVGHLDRVRAQPVQQPLDPPRVHRPVAAGAGQPRRRHGDPPDPAGQPRRRAAPGPGTTSTTSCPRST